MILVFFKKFKRNQGHGVEIVQTLAKFGILQMKIFSKGVLFF